MMSDRHRTPTEGWYHPQTSDRSTIGQRRVEDLQRQIASMENNMKEKSALMHKLSRLQEVEDEKREIQDKVLERNSRNNSPRLLQSEMDRLYGRESHLDRNESPGKDRNTIETVIQHRTKEFSAKQQETALKAKYLDKERHRLQEARERVQEQRRMLQNMSPAERGQSESGLTRPRGMLGRDGQFSLPTAESQREVQGIDSFIQQTVEKLPATMNKIWTMRENLEKHYRYYKKPYNGELGLRSYEHWQLQDYFMCREIVDDLVENFINLYFKHDDVVEKGTYKAQLEEEKTWMHRQSEAMSEKKAILLIGEELVLDETSDMITEVIEEMHHLYGSLRNTTETMLMSEAEMVATGQDTERDPADRVYNLVTKAYFSTKDNRNRHRKETWSHSQYAQNKVKKRKITRKAGGQEVVEEVEEEEEEEEDIDAPDMTIIDFNTISPLQLRGLEPSLIDSTEVKQDKETFQRYMRRELEYWHKMETKVHHHYFHKKCNGIKLIRASPNHRFIAVGTYHGDLIIYDALMAPWRPFRVLAYHQKEHNHMIDIAWSLDSCRIITINSLGYLQVISIAGGPVDQEDAQNMGLPADDKGIFAHQLQLLLDLDVERQDFIFQQGLLAEEEVQNDVGLAPQKAAFFPSISFLSTQNDIMVSLENGDILKCNIQNSLKTANAEFDEDDEDEDENVTTEAPRIYKPSLVTEEEAVNINTIGQNVEAELLRGHKKGIIYICFVEFLNAMITVDQKGFINKWKYNIKFKSSYGWYTPSRKYKIETSKIMYKESGTDKPKVVFTDRVAPGRKPRTRQEVAAQRRRVQNTLDNMQLGDPWHEEYLDDEEMILQVYAPRGVIADSGAMFHIVYKHMETEQLSTYITRLYKPVKVRCTRIVRVIGSPTSTELVFILLFGAYPPKGPHITIFVLDLKTMDLRDFRKDIPLSGTEYTLMMTKSIISTDITRVFGPTGTNYMFIIFNGKLRCISLTSGQPVVKMGQKAIVYGNQEEDEEEEDEEEDEDREADDVFKGCIVDERTVVVPPDSECTALCFEGKIYCIVFARKLPQMIVVEFVDKNVYADRRAMWKTYTALQHHQLVPAELRVNTFNWKFDDIQHPAVAARKILMRKIDMEMRKAGLIRDHPKIIRRIALSDKVENYRTLDHAVTNSDLLEKEGVNARRAPSRLASVTPEVADDDKF